MSMRVLSLGAGVQSTTLLYMAERGEIERFDRIVFADTGWEPPDVYAHLTGLLSEIMLDHPDHPDNLRIDIVSAGNIREDLIANAKGEGDRFASLPVYLTNPDGGSGMLRRQCTKQYKLDPIRRYLRAIRNGATIDLVMGISLDEAVRMRDSDVRYIRNVYPLVDLRMTRADCMAWLTTHGYPIPPKSACVGCPFHDNRRWREIRDAQPEAWTEAVAVDQAIRRLPRIDGDVFLHRDRVPLDQVDLSTPEDRGQLPLFAMECEGLCGV